MSNKLNIKHTYTTANHQQGNGIVERFNWFLKTVISIFVKNEKGEWDDLLYIGLFSVRITTNIMNDDTSFYVLYGRNPILQFT